MFMSNPSKGTVTWYCDDSNGACVMGIAFSLSRIAGIGGGGDIEYEITVYCGLFCAYHHDRCRMSYLLSNVVNLVEGDIYSTWYEQVS
ncbi:Hypothetical protein PHPALM_10344 [Phytophthora palmivora]|uniref:Uncharacterized protein n=1 Tax=Phytophthora palmivora TaxID=4796 RepID=A0A2P4Y4Z5_9STRA|nr:Hypothetical protein PHPALM_10344 [Phytophthora palmivora]